MATTDSHAYTTKQGSEIIKRQDHLGTAVYRCTGCDVYCAATDDQARQHAETCDK
ncbi:hypothetical protein [Kitasatospora sp. NPDC001132]